MIRLNTPIESIVINLQSAGEVNYNIQYVFVRNGVTLNKSVEGILTTSGQHVVLINDYSSGYFDITYLNITNIDPAQNYISVLKKTSVNETNLTSEAIGLKNRECIEFTSDSGFKTLDQNGSFKTITSSVSADGDVENSDMSYMATVPSGGSLTLPDSDIEVNGVPEGVVVSVKTISVDLNDGTNPVSPTLVTLVGNLLTITLPDIGDVTVENSDASYQVVEPSGGTLVLPDSQINVNGVDEGDVVSVKAINVDLTDGVNPVVPTSVGLVGNTLTITLPASGGGDVDIEINGVPYDTITAPATVDIPVINTTPVPVGTIVGTDVVVGDSTVNVRKSDATLISAVTVVAEGVASYSVGDSTAVIKDSVGTTLKSEGILAATSENITINNSTVNIRNTAATLLHSVSVRAEATTTQDIADTTVENSDASYSVNVLAEGSLILPDQQINVNSVDEGDIPSVGTIDIDLSDGVNPVTPTSVTITGRTIDIVVPSGGVTMNVDFSADKLTAYQLENITFTDLSDESPTHWSWRFSDGASSIVQNPVKSFSSTGFYNVILMAGRVGAGGVNIKNSYIEIITGFFTDLYGLPTAAFSLRKLSPNTTYSGAAIRVRRSSDNTEQDINFVSSAANAPIDTSALLSFVGSGDGFVVTWYNQNGSGNHATQTTAANQPQIVTSGVVELSSSLPSIKWDGSNDFLLINSVFTSTMNLTTFLISQSAAVSSNQYIYDNSNSASFGGGYALRFLSTGGFRAWAQDANINASGGSTSNNTPYLVSQMSRITLGTTENNEVWVNNSNVGNTSGIPSARNAKTTTRIGHSELLGGFLNGKISELIAYDSYKSTDRAAMTTNINAYYNVF